MNREPGKIYDGYKVVYKLSGLIHSNILGSCFADNNRVVYNMNKWAFPMVGAGPLAVFVNKEKAMVFRGTMPWLAVYTCKYKKSKHRQLWYNMASMYRTYKPESELPDGTDFADAVMITEEVGHEQEKDS
jgi:hypothetical protein